jgi:hypothetical protein
MSRDAPTEALAIEPHFGSAVEGGQRFPRPSPIRDP